MERELLKLLDDFRSGKLDAFQQQTVSAPVQAAPIGTAATTPSSAQPPLPSISSLAQLDAIRARQEELTMRHLAEQADIIQSTDFRLVLNNDHNRDRCFLCSSGPAANPEIYSTSANANFDKLMADVS